MYHSISKICLFMKFFVYEIRITTWGANALWNISWEILQVLRYWRHKLLLFGISYDFEELKLSTIYWELHCIKRAPKAVFHQGGDSRHSKDGMGMVAVLSHQYWLHIFIRFYQHFLPLLSGSLILETCGSSKPSLIALASRGDCEHHWRVKGLNCINKHSWASQESMGDDIWGALREIHRNMNYYCYGILFWNLSRYIFICFLKLDFFRGDMLHPSRKILE